MKMTSSEPASQTSGLQSNGFGLTNTSKIIDIVINKMYMNKPGAVIRELSANAWDAHVEAGKQDVPFEIHMPTWISKNFSIRDYGNGIPHDIFEHIYTNIGGSTKDDSNDLIGGFGLGSKTPFTMVDQFTVTNIHKGQKSVWLCYKDSGTPMVSRLSLEDTKEPSGVLVEFTFSEDLAAEFAKQLPKQLKYFPVKPKVTGGEHTVVWPELPKGWEDAKDYFYEKRSGGSYGQHAVVMGNVNYELDPNQLDRSFTGLFQKSLTIKCDIGDVDIPPSRETLEYTERTKKFLNAKLSEIRKTYTTEWKKGLEACDNLWDFCKHIRDTNTNLISTHSDLTYDGKTKRWFEWSIDCIPVPSFIDYPLKHVDTAYAQVFRGASLRITDTKPEFYVNDLGKGGRTWINTQKDKCRGFYMFDVGVCTKDTLQAHVDECTKQVEKHLGVKPKLLSSVIGMPQKGASKPRAKVAGVFKLVRSSRPDFNCFEEYKGDIPTEGYYVKLRAKTVEGRFNSCMDLVFENLDKPVYGIRERGMKAAANLTELEPKHLIHLKEQAIARYINIMKRENAAAVYDGNRRLLEIPWQEKDLRSFSRNLKRVSKARRVDHYDNTRLLSLLDVRISGIEVPETYVSKQFRTEIKPKYGKLFDCFGSTWNPTKGYQALNEFLNKQRKTK